VRFSRLRMFGLASRGAGFSARAGRRRTASVAFAFSALALLLLAPVCDAVAAQAAHLHAGSAAAHADAPAQTGGDGDHDSPGCCSTIEGSTLLNPANPLIDGSSGEGWNAAAPPFVRSVETLYLPRDDTVRGAVPPRKSFYARSARIRQ